MVRCYGVNFANYLYLFRVLMFGACSLHLLLFLDGEIPKLKVVFLVVYLDVADPDNIFDVHGAANLVRCR